MAKHKYATRGARRNVYADNVLLAYIDGKMVEHHNRPFSAEVVELLEQGIIKRDGAQAFKGITKARKQAAKPSK